MTRIKVCGITTLEDALVAAGAGADMLGFNFYPKSPRYIAPEAARALTDALREQLGSRRPLFIGVFVNESASSVAATLSRAGMDFAQLSGDESNDMLRILKGSAFKAIRPRNREEALDDAAYFLAHAPSDERLPSLLLDAHHPELYGGTGEAASLEVALAVREAVPRLMLAGGLTPDNVGQRIRAVRPWGVDVASGVEGETPGRKDESCLRAFVAAVRVAEADVSR